MESNDEFLTIPNSSLYDQSFVRKVFTNEVKGFSKRKLRNLCLSGILEKYLWVHFDSKKVSFEHTISILVLVNQKFLDGHSTIFDFLCSQENGIEKFDGLFSKALEICLSDLKTVSNIKFKLVAVSFLVNAYRCIENETIRKCCLKYLSISIWEFLSSSRLSEEFQNSPFLEKQWKLLKTNKSDKKEENSKKRKANANLIEDEDKSLESTFFYNFLSEFLQYIEEYNNNVEIEKDEESMLVVTSDENMSSDYDILLNLYIGKCLELFVDLLSQLSTRRFLLTLMNDMNLLVRIKLSSFVSKESSKCKVGNHKSVLLLLVSQLSTLFHYNDNETSNIINGSSQLSDFSGYRRLFTINRLQQVSFTPALKNLLLPLALCPIGRLDSSNNLLNYLSPLSLIQLQSLALLIPVVTEDDLNRTRKLSQLNGEDEDKSVEMFIKQVLIDRICKSDSSTESSGLLPIYPTEDLLFDSNKVPGNSSGSSVVTLTTSSSSHALPRLNLQFLDIKDYLYRNLNLILLENASEVKQELVEVLYRIKPQHLFGNTTNSNSLLSKENSSVRFGGWARMAIPISQTQVIEVGESEIGNNYPTVVKCCTTFDLSVYSSTQIRNEWDNLKSKDVVYFVTFNMDSNSNKLDDKMAENDIDKLLRDKIQSVRGAEVIEVKDEDNNSLRPGSTPKSSKRRIVLKLDPFQYSLDLHSSSSSGVSAYESAHILMRRLPERNGLSFLLGAGRQLSTSRIGGETNRQLPGWINNIMLGYGDPSHAHYQSLLRASSLALNSSSSSTVLDWGDVFSDSSQLATSFPTARIVIRGENISPPFLLNHVVNYNGNDEEEVIFVDSKSRPPVSPYNSLFTNKNKLVYTPIQVEAIKSGLNSGLSLIVGPPGTGKTDVAVEIINGLYRNNTKSKTLIITHSNNALNDIFEKLINCNEIPSKHLLRLGGGEYDLRNTLQKNDSSALNFESGFSGPGRVDWCLQRRIDRLSRVARLAESLNLSLSSTNTTLVNRYKNIKTFNSRDVSDSCENALYFYNNYVLSLIEDFEYYLKLFNGNNLGEINANIIINSIDEIFPFHLYFSDIYNSENVVSTDSVLNIPETLVNYTQDMALGCIMHLRELFEEIAELRPFEILRTHQQRIDYLLMKQARVIAMTCTHAAMLRQRLIDIDFNYDSVVIEEAGQIMEIETLIPLTLQSNNSSSALESVESKSLSTSLPRRCISRLVLIGDPYQLPPIITNNFIGKCCGLSQTLFSRLLRLGCPAIYLNQQGRSRLEISQLYSWRYNLIFNSLYNNSEILSSSSKYVKYLQRIHNNSSGGNSFSLGTLPSLLSTNLSNNLDDKYLKYRQANAGFLHTFQAIDVPDFKGKGEECPSPHFYINVGEAEYVVQVYMFMRLIGYPSESIAILTSYNGQKSLLKDVLAARCQSPVFGMPLCVCTVDEFQGRQADFVLLSLVRTHSAGHMRDARRLVVALSRARLGLYVFCRLQLFSRCFELERAFKLLSRVSDAADGNSEVQHDKLQLVVGEEFGAASLRGAEDSSVSGIYSVQDVTDMGIIVYRMVQQLSGNKNQINEADSSGL